MPNFTISFPEFFETLTLFSISPTHFRIPLTHFYILSTLSAASQPDKSHLRDLSVSKDLTESNQKNCPHKGYTKYSFPFPLPFTTVRLPLQQRVVVWSPPSENVNDKVSDEVPSFHHLFISMRETVTSLSSQHNQTDRWVLAFMFYPKLTLHPLLSAMLRSQLAAPGV